MVRVSKPPTASKSLLMNTFEHLLTLALVLSSAWLAFEPAHSTLSGFYATGFYTTGFYAPLAEALASASARG